MIFMMTDQLKKGIVFLVTMLLFSSMIFLQTHGSAQPEKNRLFISMEEKSEDKSMSAITISSLPFILAIKFLVFDKDE